jgi:nucleoside phosphorylase/CheY-like chemotaxis protein
MKILIVEDSPEKRQRISRVLASTSIVDLELVEYAQDLLSARRRLRDTHFDLLILDIALPLRADQEPTEDAGVLLLKELLSTPQRLLVPAHVVGITGIEDAYRSALHQFSSRALSLLRYDESSTDWEMGLAARVHHIHSAAASNAVSGREFHSDLGIVCALYSPELTAVLRLPWEWSQISLPGDHTIYWRGKVAVQGRDLIVHAAHAPRMGMPAAATLASKIISNFRPRYIVMPGIMAGVRGRVNLGDVVAADPCWDWGSGKWLHDSSGSKFLQAPHQIPLAQTIRERIRLMSHDSALLNNIRDGWAGDPPQYALAVQLGPVASGASVLADEAALQRVIEQHRQLLGLEMEIYGVYAAAEEAAEPRPQAFSLKSVVDFADSAKSDAHRQYSAYTSAEVLRRFVEKYLFE